ncbi:MAG: helix-turn-helix domain-containing protein [Rubripirellula sp.]|nr:helix-turn-helix domain-containing protein [Rubripirellula sp.]
MFDFKVVPADAENASQPPTRLEWLTVKETAEMLGVSPQTVRNMIASGRLKAAPAGNGVERKAWIIKRTDLDALSKHHDDQPTKPSRQAPERDSGRWGL